MKKAFQKRNLKVDCDDDPLAGSIYSEIGPDGLRFLKDNIKVSKDGLSKIGDNNLNNHFQPINMEQIQIINKHLGRGASSNVSEGIYKPLNVKVAIKSINAYDKEKRHQLMNDIRILLQNKINAENNGYYCQFLVSLYGAFYDDGSVKIVLELMDGGSIGDILRIYKSAEIAGPLIEESVLAKIAQQTLNGLSYLHIISNQIHRDIKPDNVLLSQNGYVKLTDFGISRDLEQSAFCTTVVGTYIYMSPERIQGRKYNHLSDIWSFGIMLFEMGKKTTGTYPYSSTKTYIEMLQSVVNEPSPSLPQNMNFSKNFRDFLNLCLQKKPRMRASAAELLSHPWILSNFCSGQLISQWLVYVKKEILPKATKSRAILQNNKDQQNLLLEQQLQLSRQERIISNHSNSKDESDLALSQQALRLTKDKDGIIKSIQVSQF